MPDDKVEKQHRKLKRQWEREWRRKLCVDLANDALEANREAGHGQEYLSPSFQLLIKKYL